MSMSETGDAFRKLREESPSASVLLRRLRETDQILRDSAEQQIRDHNTRFKEIRAFYDSLFERILVRATQKYLPSEYFDKGHLR